MITERRGPHITRRKRLSVRESKRRRGRYAAAVASTRYHTRLLALGIVGSIAAALVASRSRGGAGTETQTESSGEAPFPARQDP